LYYWLITNFNFSEQQININTQIIYTIHLYQENMLIILKNCLIIEIDDYIDTLFIKGLYKKIEVIAVDQSININLPDTP
jgi:hypothetical protein